MQQGVAYSMIAMLGTALFLTGATMAVDPTRDMLIVPMCHGGITSIPLRRNRGGEREPACPGGCHVTCQKRIEDEEEE